MPAFSRRASSSRLPLVQTAVKTPPHPRAAEEGSRAIWRITSSSSSSQTRSYGSIVPPRAIRRARISGVPAPRLRLPSTVNVAGATLLEKLAEARGREPALDAASVEIAEHWFWVDSRKAARELGFAPRDPQETLQDTVLDLLSRMPEKQWPGTKGRLASLRRG